MNYEAIKNAAAGYKSDMVKFLRDMIAIPSESCEEERVVKRIAAKKAKDFAEADRIRDELASRGYAVEDTPQGPKVRKL